MTQPPQQREMTWSREARRRTCFRAH